MKNARRERLYQIRHVLFVLAFFAALLFAFYRADGIIDLLIYALLGMAGALLFYLLFGLLLRLFLH